MSVPVFQATVVNEFGELLPAATVTVLVEATGQPAVLYSDRNGTVPLGTLGVFSVDAEAFAQFFAAPDNYRVTANDSGSGFSRTWDYVVLTGTAATVDTGAAAGQVPLNSDLGSASLVDTGLLTGNVPTADDLSMVGQTINYTGGNLNPNVFGGTTAGVDIAVGTPASVSVAEFYLPISSAGVDPISLTIVGTFSIYDGFNNLLAAGVTPSLFNKSSNKVAIIRALAGGMVANQSIRLNADSSASQITVNF